MKRISSENLLVMKLAATTIVEGLRRYDYLQRVSTSLMFLFGRVSQKRKLMRSVNNSLISNQSHNLTDSPIRCSNTWLNIIQISVNNLRSVKWNGDNDPYVVIHIGSWRGTTKTIWSGGNNVSWGSINCGIQLTSPSIDDIHDIEVEVYNAYLAREDYLIGVGSTSLAHLELGKCASLMIDLFERNNKSRNRGLLTIDVRLEAGNAPDATMNENITIENVSANSSVLSARDASIFTLKSSVSGDNARRGTTNPETWGDVSAPSSECCNEKHVDKMGSGNNAKNPNHRVNAAPQAQSLSDSDGMLKRQPSTVRKSSSGQISSRGSARTESNQAPEQNTSKKSLDGKNSQQRVTGMIVQQRNSEAPESKGVLNPVANAYSTEGAKTTVRSALSIVSSKGLVSQSAERKSDEMDGKQHKQQPSATKDKILYARNPAESKSNGVSGTAAVDRREQKVVASESKNEVIQGAGSSGVGNDVKDGDRPKKSKRASVSVKAVLPIATPVVVDINLISRYLSSVDARQIDEIMSISMRGDCATVVMTLEEVSLVLEALGYVCQSPTEARELCGKDVPPLTLRSYTCAAPLAQSLTTYARSYGLFKSADTCVSEVKAGLAAKHLTKLVEGPWKKARGVILSACEAKDGAGRPSRWDEVTLRKVLHVAQLPEDALSGFDGRDFLGLSAVEIEDKFGKIPSVLRSRLQIYQHMARLIEHRWDQGTRPSDLASATGAAQDAVGEEEGEAYKGKASGGVRASKGGERVDASHQSLQVEGLRDGTLVVVAPADMLLCAWIPVCRAYGWGISLEKLASLSALLARLKGRIVAKPYGATINVSSCEELKWVSFSEDCGSSMTLEALRDMQGRDFVSGRAVLLPTSCLTACASSVRSKAMQSSAPVTPLSSLNMESIAIGMPVKVASLQVLTRTCERFDWWDRPTQKVLEAVAGQRAEVLSVTELQSRGRVGLRFPSLGICDALPAQAVLLPESKPVIARQNSSQSSTSTIKRRLSTGSSEPVSAKTAMQTAAMKIAVEVRGGGAGAEGTLLSNGSPYEALLSPDNGGDQCLPDSIPAEEEKESANMFGADVVSVRSAPAAAPSRHGQIQHNNARRPLYPEEEKESANMFGADVVSVRSAPAAAPSRHGQIQHNNARRPLYRPVSAGTVANSAPVLQPYSWLNPDRVLVDPPTPSPLSPYKRSPQRKKSNGFLETKTKNSKLNIIEASFNPDNAYLPGTTDKSNRYHSYGRGVERAEDRPTDEPTSVLSPVEKLYERNYTNFVNNSNKSKTLADASRSGPSNRRGAGEEILMKQDESPGGSSDFALGIEGRRYGSGPGRSSSSTGKLNEEVVERANNSTNNGLEDGTKRNSARPKSASSVRRYGMPSNVDPDVGPPAYGSSNATVSSGMLKPKIRPKSASGVRKNDAPTVNILAAKTNEIKFPMSAAVNGGQSGAKAGPTRAWDKLRGRGNNVANVDDDDEREAIRLQRLHRELRRSERQAMTKEKVLQRQLKKYGIDPKNYESYSNV